MTVDEATRFAWDATDVVLVPLVASATEFANPWHDEIGRFAPKGYVQSGIHIKRQVLIGRNAEDVAVLAAAAALHDAVYQSPEATGLHQSLVKKVIAAAAVADPDLVEQYIKPAAKAMGLNNREQGREQSEILLNEAIAVVFSPFVEKFDVPEPEKVTIEKVEITRTNGSPASQWRTLTPEGHTITFDPNNYQIAPDQIEMILSAATTAVRAGNVSKDINIRISPSFEREDGIPVRQPLVMGFVDISPDKTRHLTVNVTPELIAGNFEEGGVTGRDPQLLMASASTVATLRNTVQHEIGHVSVFEETLNGKGQDWFNESMNEAADSVTFVDLPFTSQYGRTNTTEMHAEAFSEWVNTGGTTNNPVVRTFAEIFGWSNPITGEPFIAGPLEKTP